MNNYKLYGRSDTGSDVVEYLFREFNVEYEFIHVDENRAKQDRKILKDNPLGRVPMIELPDGSFLIESLAIVYHLTETFDGLMPKKNDPLRIKYHQFMSFLATSVYTTYHRLYHGDQYVSANNEKELSDNASKDLKTMYHFIEKNLNPFICEQELTAVDFYLFMLTGWHKDLNNLVEKNQNISKFLELMKARPSVAAIRKLQKERG